MRTSRRLSGICTMIITVTLAPASRASGQDYPFPTNDLPGPNALPGMKSPGTATTLSLLGTVVPMGLAVSGVAGDTGWGRAGLMLGGWLLGPSLGYVYAGDAGHGLKGMAARAKLVMYIHCMYITR